MRGRLLHRLIRIFIIGAFAAVLGGGALVFRGQGGEGFHWGGAFYPWRTVGLALLTAGVAFYLVGRSMSFYLRLKKITDDKRQRSL